MPNQGDVFVEQTPKYMAIGEAIAYTIDYADIGTPSSAGTVTAYDATGADVSGAVLSGSASLAGDIVTLKRFTPASAQTYRIFNTVSIGSNTIIAALDVICYAIAPSSTVTNGYCTLAELKRYITPNESTDPLDDQVLIDIIEAASRFIDGVTGRTFYARTETRYFSVPEGQDARKLFLDDDLLTVTTLTNGDGTVLTTADYYLLPRNLSPKYAVVLKESSSYYWIWDSSNNSEYVISIAGTWGYAASAPDDVKDACRMIALSMDKRRSGENISAITTITGGGVVVTPQDVPSIAAKILEKYKRIV